MGKTICFATMR